MRVIVLGALFLLVCGGCGWNGTQETQVVRIRVVQDHSGRAQSTCEASSDSSARFTYAANKVKRVEIAEMVIVIPVDSEDIRRLVEEAAALHKVSSYTSSGKSISISWWLGERTGTLTAMPRDLSLGQSEVLSGLVAEIDGALNWFVAKSIACAETAEVLLAAGDDELAGHQFSAAGYWAEEWVLSIHRRGMRHVDNVLLAREHKNSFPLPGESRTDTARRLRAEYLAYRDQLFVVTEVEKGFVVTLKKDQWVKIEQQR